MLAVPVLVAVYLAALRARGGSHRVLAALGAAPRSSPSSPSRASRPRRAPRFRRPRRPRSPPRCSTPSAPGTRVTAPIQVEFDAPMDAASVAGALRIVARQRRSASRGTPRAAADDRPDGALAARTRCTRVTIDAQRALRGRRPARRRRSAASSSPRPRARRRSRADRDARAVGPRRHRRSRSSSTGPSRSRPCARRSASSPRSTATRAPGASDRRLPLHAVRARSAPATEYRIWLDGPRRRRRRAVRRRPAIDGLDTVGAPSVRPLPAASTGRAKVERAALALGPVHAADGPRRDGRARSRRPRRQAAWPARSPGPRTARCSCSRRRRRSPYGATRRDDASTGPPDRGPARASRPRRRRSRSCPSPRRASAPRPAQARQPAARGGAEADANPHAGGGGAVERAAGTRSSLLPAAHELHPDRRLGHRRAASARRPAAGTSRRSSLSGRSRARVSRPYAQRLATNNQCDHFIGGDARATACGTRATPATAGARTSAAGRATRSAPCSGRTCSSRARSPTTAATTGT